MTDARTTAAHPVARWLLLLALLAIAAGCGVRADSRPQEINAADLPADLLDPNPPTSTTAPGANTAVTVYMLVRQGDVTRLALVSRDVADASRPADRINALLAPATPDEQALGLITSIPTDTVLLDTQLVPESRELVVDLSGALFDVQGEELANAFAQLVWTVTELDAVRQVRFKVDGRAYRAPNAEGVEQQGAVTRGDYNALAPEPAR
ncbi:MAG: GerMN domain-containing protein [Microthrixaceae bacterium]